MNTIEKINMRINHLRNPLTRSNRKSIVNKFINVVGEKETYDEYDAMKFFDWAEKHYKGQSIILIYSIIKWLYNKMGFNFGDIEMPDYENNNIYAIPNEDIKKLIQAILLYSTSLKLLVALSTTYGMRRIEMSRVKKEDIDIEHSKFFVRTAKSGVRAQRWMYMPDEIKPVMEEYLNKCDHIKPPGVVSISAYFWKACDIAGVPLNLSSRIGWHSIRRSLIIGLTSSGLNDNDIIQFMRWKSKDNASSILYRYRSTQNNDGIIENIDKKVFEVHPFMKFWHNNEGT